MDPDGWGDEGLKDVTEDIRRLEVLQSDISRVRGSIQGQLQVLDLAVRETEDSDGSLFPYHPGSLGRSAGRSGEAMEWIRRRYDQVAVASARSAADRAASDSG
ncbi:hypothetical protein GCM10009642_41730 [Nocardiopsis metallicus]